MVQSQQCSGYMLEGNPHPRRRQTQPSQNSGGNLLSCRIRQARNEADQEQPVAQISRISKCVLRIPLSDQSTFSAFSRSLHKEYCSIRGTFNPVLESSSPPKLVQRSPVSQAFSVPCVHPDAKNLLSRGSFKERK